VAGGAAGMILRRPQRVNRASKISKIVHYTNGSLE